VSQGFDLYKRKTNATSLSVGPYNTDAVGGGIKFGYPISEKVLGEFRPQPGVGEAADLRQQARRSTSTS